MLIDFERGAHPVLQPYFLRDFHRWHGQLHRWSPLAVAAIYQDVDGEFSARATHPTAPVLTWSWIVGDVWRPPFDDIYNAMNPIGLTTPSAVAQAYDDAAKFLGLIFMDVAIRRPDRWGSHHSALRGMPITARTYYLL